jgi:hypothetical protein
MSQKPQIYYEVRERREGVSTMRLGLVIDRFHGVAPGYKPCLNRICARKSRSASEVAITAIANAFVSAADIIS